MLVTTRIEVAVNTICTKTSVLVQIVFTATFMLVVSKICKFDSYYHTKSAQFNHSKMLVPLYFC